MSTHNSTTFRSTKRANFFRRMSSAMPAIWEQELKNTCWIRRDAVGAFQPARYKVILVFFNQSPSGDPKTLQ